MIKKKLVLMSSLSKRVNTSTNHVNSGADPHRFPPFYGNRSHFNIKYIFKNKNIFQVKIWQLSYLNDSETQERGL